MSTHNKQKIYPPVALASCGTLSPRYSIYSTLTAYLTRHSREILGRSWTRRKSISANKLAILGFVVVFGQPIPLLPAQLPSSKLEQSTNLNNGNNYFLPLFPQSYSPRLNSPSCTNGIYLQTSFHLFLVL